MGRAAIQATVYLCSMSVRDFPFLQAKEHSSLPGSAYCSQFGDSATEVFGRGGSVTRR